MNLLLLSFRLLIREWRAGELTVLAAALIIAVASVTTVSFFNDRVEKALRDQAGQLLGADLVIVADHPLDSAFSAEARRLKLRTAETEAFPSMVLNGEHSHLAEIKAVSPGYPLRGHLRIADQGEGADRETEKIPVRGTVWVERQLLTALGIGEGGHLGIGDVRLKVAHVLTREPDRGGGFFNIAPRLLMNVADLPATGLIQSTSRVSYRLLVAGEPNAVKMFRAWAQTRVDRGERIEGVEDARPEIRSALDRARSYLGLASVVATALAAVAVALGARRFMQRHMDAWAMMRCLGANQWSLVLLYLLQFFWLGVVASLIGGALGFGTQEALSYWLGSLVASRLPLPTAWPLAESVLVGTLLLLAFSLPPLLRLRGVPAIRVLRRDLGVPELFGTAAYGLGFVSIAGLLLWKAGDIKLGLYALGGLGAALLAAAALSLALVAGIHLLRGRVLGPWAYGLTNLSRRKAGSVVQTVAFSLGIMALLLLTLVRTDLLEAWKSTLPANAPNRFVINIQPDQLEPLRAFFSKKGLPAPPLYPMIRGRLVAINGRPVSPADYLDRQAKRLVEREFNLSWSNRLQRGNSIAAGHWWGAGARNARALSVETGIADTLGIQLGDVLTYDVAGKSFSAPVTSLRKVDWDSFQVNFFVVGTPALLDGFPASYITSFYVPPGNGGLLDAMVRAFPNLTVIDVAAIMAEVKRIIDRVASAVEFVFLFTLLSGVVVLYAAVNATQDERIREAAVLRTLGASRRRLLVSQTAEFASIGILAGGVAAAGASGAAYLLGTRVFNLPYAPNPWIWGIGMLAGGVGVALAGLAASRKVLRRPPLQVLRGLS